MNTAGVTNIRALPLRLCMKMFFVQLWNELGGVKCKAGLCPAYVPPTDRENDQSQDLPPKGMTVTANEVNILHLGWEPIRAFLSGMGGFTLSLVQLCWRKGEAHAIVQSRCSYITPCDISSLHYKQFGSVSPFHPSFI